MAPHCVSFTPGSYVRFGNLDIILLSEDLLTEPVAITHPRVTPGFRVRFGSLDFVPPKEDTRLASQPAPLLCLTTPIEVATAVGALQLCAPEAPSSEDDELHTFDYRRFERQLSAFLGPQPSQEDLRHLFFSVANITT